MADIVIEAENLGKQYTIGHQAERGHYLALRDVLMQDARELWHKTEDLLRGKPILAGDTREEIWALKDVSFEIHRGEAVGIIGRNGAGKSTLLKVLSRITEPTAGRVTIKGRVASLLEVGTGFHPELTGRENIYLNGAILGMNRAEIRRKFDEIVAFAEVEKFLDTPVKRFSSGMYVRLAFAVAAHLEPEILIVDEVLAVGDAKFQEKCLGRMDNVTRSGRTVLFVSHNMSAIQTLCPTAILLEGGEIDRMGPTPDTVRHYLGKQAEISTKYCDLRHQLGRVKGSIPILTDVWLRDETDGLPYDGRHKPLQVILRVEPRQPLLAPAIGFSVEDILGQPVFSVTNYFAGKTLPPIETATRITCSLPDLPLWHGSYFLNVGVGVTNDPLMDHIQRAVSFTVHSTNDETDSRISPTRHGALRIQAEWTVINE
jgi:lipopolysaccharide transport system ATP-binding protein